MGLSFWTDTSSSSPYQENDIKTFFLDNDQPRWHIEWLSVGMAFGLVFVMSRVYNFIQAMRVSAINVTAALRLGQTQCICLISHFIVDCQ